MTDSPVVMIRAECDRCGDDAAVPALSDGLEGIVAAEIDAGH